MIRCVTLCNMSLKYQLRNEYCIIICLLSIVYRQKYIKFDETQEKMLRRNMKRLSRANCDVEMSREGERDCSEFNTHEANAYHITASYI